MTEKMLETRGVPHSLHVMSGMCSTSNIFAFSIVPSSFPSSTIRGFGVKSFQEFMAEFCIEENT